MQSLMKTVAVSINRLSYRIDIDMIIDGTVTVNFTWQFFFAFGKYLISIRVEKSSLYQTNAVIHT